MKQWCISLTFLVALGTSGVSAQPQNAMIDGVVAVVGTSPVLYSDLATRLEQARQAGEKVEDELICSELEAMLFEKLLIDQARLDSVVVDEAQVTAELDRRIRYFEMQIGGRDKLEEFYGKTVAEIKDDFHDQVYDQLLIQNMQQRITADLKVTPRDVERFFREIPQDSLPYMNSEVEYAQILRLPKASLEEERRVRQKIEEYRRSILDGDKDFCTVAILYSEDPGSAANCGELGMVPSGVMVPEFDAVAMSLKDGEISQVFETDFGFHFMQMIERRGEQYNARHVLMKPKVVAIDLERQRVFLDSIRTKILEGDMNFGKAAAELSDDEETRSNNGLVSEPNSNSLRWPMGQLDRETAFALNTLEPGEIGLPQLLIRPDGSKAYRIVRLNVRTEPHVANLREDYQMIQQAAEGKLRSEAVDKWVGRKLANTYVRFMKGYDTCTYKHPWIEITSE